ncbi:MAG: CBS domain-containing protein [Candidatus Sericytochromatia bacterium]|nr:CBS domain-containing protein [Candidatus Sericytochromatia bacterium]
MTRHVVAVTPATLLPEAARILKQEDIGVLPIVEPDGSLRGILTDRDITVRAVAEGSDVRHVTAGEVCTHEPVLTVFPETSLSEAEAVMRRHRVRRLPIVSDERQLVGMLSLADIIQHADADSWQGVLLEVSRPGGEHTQRFEGESAALP